MGYMDEEEGYTPNTQGGTGTASNSTPSGASQPQPRSKVGNLVKTAIKMYAMGGLGAGGDASAAGANVPTGEGGGGGTTGMGAAAKAPKAGEWGGPGGGVTGKGPGSSDSGLLGYGGNKGGGKAKDAGLPDWLSKPMAQAQDAQASAGYARSSPATATMDWVSSYLANRPDIQGP